MEGRAGGVVVGVVGGPLLVVHVMEFCSGGSAPAAAGGGVPVVHIVEGRGRAGPVGGAGGTPFRVVFALIVPLIITAVVPAAEIRRRVVLPVGGVVGATVRDFLTLLVRLLCVPEVRSDGGVSIVIVVVIVVVAQGLDRKSTRLNSSH